MNFLSVCSGIEAASVAWGALGWEAVGFSEIEAFPSAVLRHHYPAVPNLGDMTKYREWEIERPDVLVGGTPCQSFSVAGLRKGLADPRGNLALVYCGILDRFRPKWFVWENVPGVLSSGGGRDFGSFLGAVAELGYGFAYRVLDAQFFGVAQRRRRVFVIGYLGDWRRAAAVLFERESLRRDTAPSRQARKVAPTIPSRSSAGGGLGTDCDGGLITGTLEATLGRSRGAGTPTAAIVEQPYAVANCLTARMHKGINSTLDEGQTPVVAPTITAANDPSRSPQSSEVTQQVASVHSATMQVRRLTPVECERLQGFPDNYTNIPWRGKPESPDGPRYKALGNSMAVPVMRWIGERMSAYVTRSLA